MYSLKEIAQITNSTFIGKNDQNVHSFLTDSRELSSASGVLFIALRTGKNDAHSYIPQLIEKGVKAFLICEKGIDTKIFADKDVSFVVAKDSLHALQLLAKHHRSQFKIPVIGITGSNGKTTVKEWLYQLLKSDHSICRSPKSYNSQIGVPLSILNLNSSHTLAIFEAGISRPGEMALLKEMIRPTFGILTSIGTAHDVGFKNKKEKIAEKLLLVEDCAQIIINGINKSELNDAVKENAIVLNTSADADIQFELKNEKLILQGKIADTFEIPFQDPAAAQNIATCIETLSLLGIANSEIHARIKQLHSIALRLEIKSGINNSLVINDFYNSDLDSLKIALNFLQQQNRRSKKSIVISDIEQSGVLDTQLYKEIAQLISTAKIDLVCGIGKKIASFRSLFKGDSLFFENTSDFIKQFPQFSYRFSDSTVLLKGARSFGFEEISHVLQLKSHDTVFEIDLNKLSSNINYYKMLIGPHVKMMCMVKAMGYGGGGSELARTLQHLGANYLAVAYADEGVELRQSQIHLPVMVMSPESESYDDIINYNLEPEIYSFRTLHQFISALDHLGISTPYPIHLKFDTGMHRLGFEEKDMEELISLLKNNSQIKVQSVFSHLSASDNPNFDDFTNEQIEKFKTICEKIEKAIRYPFLKHICNSGGVTRFKHAHFDMVRIGIGMHGIGVTDAEQKTLENVGTLKTRISQIKEVKEGESVGYNRGGKAEKNIRIATIPIGYADGFGRALGNGKFSLVINGKECKTIGSICMDMCMVDISEVNCKEGDEVIVFENISRLKKMAAAMGTITYEVLTGVSGRVKRVYVWE
jgi:alanine racemase